MRKTIVRVVLAGLLVVFPLVDAEAGVLAGHRYRASNTCDWQPCCRAMEPSAACQAPKVREPTINDQLIRMYDEIDKLKEKVRKLEERLPPLPPATRT